MANQITHLFYTEKIYNKFLSDYIKDKKEFFVGALFPDVRYVAGVDKTVTHFYYDYERGFNRDAIYINKNDSDFICGLKMHNLIDHIHTETIRNNKDFHDIHEKLRHLRAAFLMLEDDIHLKEILYLDQYKTFFNDIIDPEINFNINITKEHTDKWHRLLKQYLFNNTSDEKYFNLSMGIGCFSEESVREDIDRYHIIKEDEKIIDIIRQIEKEIGKITIDDIIKNK